ncbi:MAG TPA: sigma 54-interacting transcriptional regulator [Candidatus Coprocola pullicola]|nr:sigma 54-interacting transcriptional regulator [Candidatus Coprocola pullicola]
MTTLMEIQPFIQAYVKAIAAILETDVTVVDNHLIRVAGTGNYEKEIGATVSHNSFFEKIMTTRKSGMIKNVAEELLCSVCGKREQCKELANLAYPIFLKDSVVGVISIIAFEEQQREILLRKRNRLEEFLKYMCVLIESKLATTESKNKLEQQIRDFTLSEDKYTLVGNSAKMQEALKIATKVAKTNSTVFIRGESGTGKEIMAKMIHNMSSRREHLMISINCAAIPDTLVESELFGYEEGAFTGAKKNGSIGKFELADKSTIFLDEIGDMPLQVQTKLLRVLQEAKVERIGGKKPIPIDIRVICATNKNIEKMVEEGTFREDLYYRLNIIPIELPPLRKRKEDIIPLVEYYIAYYNQKLSKNISGISQECKKALLGYRWTGNIRELKNIIEYLANIVECGEIGISDLPEHIAFQTNQSYADRSLDTIMQEYEKKVLTKLLPKNATTEEKEEVANSLKISRATLYRKLKKYGLY